ncbi:MAG: hypothetical protein ACLT1X_10710 [Christensenellales bacterium]
MGSADRFREETIRLAPGDRIDLNDLIRRLTAMGYERVSMVEGKGSAPARRHYRRVPAGVQPEFAH